jgi:ribonuclease BN (tRNA processing enzyme)
MEAGRPVETGGVRATAFTMRHPSGAPAHALRIEAAGKVVSYTGDTEWVEDIVAAGRGADLMIAEGYTVERPVKFHLDWATLKQRLPEITPKRLMLTHMSPEMIAHPPDGYIAAEDGLVVTL